MQWVVALRGDRGVMGYWHRPSQGFVWTLAAASRYGEREAQDTAAAMRMRGLKVQAIQLDPDPAITAALDSMSEDQLLARLERATNPGGAA